jgi:hypothetical protein
MNNENGLTIQSPETPIGEAETSPQGAEAIFKDMLANLPLFLNPAPFSSGWAIAALPDPETGREVPCAILMTAQNNTASAVVFSLPNLQNFTQATMGIFQALQAEVMKASPLLVADQGQMQQALAAKKKMDSQFSARQPQGWPPEDWKK